MNSNIVKESLETALLLSEVSQSSHSLQLDGVGMVEIDNHYVALFTGAGEKKLLTSSNLEKRLNELMGETLEQSISKRLPQLRFD